MSHIFPKYRQRTGEPIDAEDMNHNLRSYVNEASGYLGEHNWSQSGITAVASLAGDAVLRVSRTRQAVNWTTMNASNEPVAGADGNALKMPTNMHWNVITGLTDTFDSRGGLLIIIASFQLDAGIISTDADYWDDLAGMQWTARIDGQLLEECVVGGLDRSNDRAGEAMRWDMGPIVVYAIVPIAPGNHTVDIVGKMSRNATFTPPDSQVYYEVFNREFILIEAH